MNWILTLVLSALISQPSTLWAEETQDSEGLNAGQVAVGLGTVTALGGMVEWIRHGSNQTMLSELQGTGPLSETTRQRLLKSGEKINVVVSGKVVRTFDFSKNPQSIENFEIVRRELIEGQRRSVRYAAGPSRLKPFIFVLGGAALVMGSVSIGGDAPSGGMEMVQPMIAEEPVAGSEM